MEIIYKILYAIGIAASWLKLGKVCNALRSCRNRIYTGYLKSGFNSFGHGSLLAWRAYNLVGLEHIAIGSRCTLERDLQLTAWTKDGKAGKITIGNGCLIRRGAHITATNSITIGNNLLTGTNVIITDNSHGATDAASLALPPGERPAVSKGAVKIGNNVWLGNNVCIMPGVSIGDGAVVGANSVVTHDIPPFCVAAGVPARVVKNNVATK